MGLAICFKWQITELMLSFIPAINGSYSDWIFSVRFSFIRWFKYLVNRRWGGRRLLNDLLIKRIFCISILSSSFRIWLDLNNRLEWVSLFMIFKAFVCRIIVLLKTCRFRPHVSLGQFENQIWQSKWFSEYVY